MATGKPGIQERAVQALRSVSAFADLASGVKLRPYQEEAARAIVDSVINRKGLAFVVVFPRQSGKNETQAQIEAYLLALFSLLQGEIVKVSPTWVPQTYNAMRRLERVLKSNPLTKGRWCKEAGHIYRVGEARLTFLSGAPTTQTVGATASLLLECDEAQSVLASKWDKDFAPMAASTNATRVFWGTAWTSQTLLARELRLARQAEAADGVRRAFFLSAEEVGACVPAYQQYVAEQVARLGRQHPLVRTQYFSEEIDAQGGMFPPRRLALMRGTHPAQEAPQPGKLYALLIDVAGEEETPQAEAASLAPAEQANPRRDATALTVVEIGLETAADELLRAPTYRVVWRCGWVGVKHSSLYGQIRMLAERWQARRVVIDATGVGAGLASFLEKALPGRVRPFIFNASSKSKLGWDFLSVIESGRYLEYAQPEGEMGRQQAEFWRQCELCELEVAPGPERRMRWGVPDGRRDPLGGQPVHDDWVLSAALCSLLDEEAWPAGGRTAGPGIAPRGDPLEEIDREGY